MKIRACILPFLPLFKFMIHDAIVVVGANDLNPDVNQLRASGTRKLVVQDEGETKIDQCLVVDKDLKKERMKDGGSGTMFEDSPKQEQNKFLVPSMTYNLYKCEGLTIMGQSPCECMLWRTVTVPAGQAVAMYEGEYTSLHQCNAHCGQQPSDICSYCDTVQQHVGGGNIVTSTVCKHVQEGYGGTSIPYSSLFANNQCFKECLRATVAQDVSLCKE